MSLDVPAIRALLPRASLDVLATLEQGQGLLALEARRPELVERVRGASGRDWLPLGLDIELSELVAATLGVEADRTRARRVLRATLDGPLLRPIVRGVELVFALDTAGLLRQAPRVWPLLYRGAGHIHYSVERGNRRRICLVDTAAAIVASPVYLEAIAAAIESTFDLSKVEGEISVEHVDARRREVEFCATWW